MKREHRTFRNIEVRAEGTGPNGRPVVVLRAIKPFVVDDYGSVWMPDTFDKRMKARMAVDPDDTPALCWSHDWADPIGHGVDYTPTAEGPDIAFELDDFDAVPRAKQADAQVRSKTIRDCSVGFSNTVRRDPTDEERVKWPGVREVIVESDLDETSLVLRGAVPGAKVLAMRSAYGVREVPEDAFLAIARKVSAGDLTVEEGKAALALAADPGDEDDDEGEQAPPPDPAAQALDAQLDADEADLVDAL